MNSYNMLVHTFNMKKHNVVDHDYYIINLDVYLLECICVLDLIWMCLKEFLGCRLLKWEREFYLYIQLTPFTKLIFGEGWLRRQISIICKVNFNSSNLRSNCRDVGILDILIWFCHWWQHLLAFINSGE